MKFQIFLVLTLSFIYGLLSAPEGVKPLDWKVKLPTLPTKPTLRPRPTGIPSDLIFCDIAQAIVDALRFVDVDKPLTDKNIYIPATAEIYLNLTFDSISCWGLKRTELTNCTTTDLDADGVGNTYVKISIDQFNIYLTNYTLTGMAGHLPLEGQGDGSVKLEDFQLSINGTYHKNAKGIWQFLTFKVDLFVYQWTVNLENLMPGTDIGTLANEVISEEGREVMNAIEEILNFNNTLMNIINDFIANR